MTAPAFGTAERRARGAATRLPDARAVLAEHVRTTGLALRAPAAFVALLLAILTLWVWLQTTTRDVDLSLNAWPTQIPGVLGALLPIAVWSRDERFGPGYLWTLPVDRRRHALVKVLAGWLWLMGGVAVFVLWNLAVTGATGGRVLPPETLLLATYEQAVAGVADPATLRSVRWVPGPFIWLVPFTGATVTYLLASALALGTRHPLRWVVGSAVAFVMGTFVGAAAGTHLGIGWLDHAPGRLLAWLMEHPHGLDAVLTARLETLGAGIRLTTGAPARVWWGVPSMADWGVATLLWAGAGLLALWAAASRHREGRRA